MIICQPSVVYDSPVYFSIRTISTFFINLILQNLVCAIGLDTHGSVDRSPLVLPWTTFDMRCRAHKSSRIGDTLIQSFSHYAKYSALVFSPSSDDNVMLICVC